VTEVKGRKISFLFSILGSRLNFLGFGTQGLFFSTTTAASLARLQQLPRNLLIKFWVDSGTCLDTKSQTQLLAAHCLGSDSQEWADSPYETADKIADNVSSMTVEGAE